MHQMASSNMIGWQLSRHIIDIPWLHNTIGYLFLLLIVTYILGIPYILYKLTKGSKTTHIEWSFEGKPWSYWKKYK